MTSMTNLETTFHITISAVSDHKVIWMSRISKFYILHVLQHFSSLIPGPNANVPNTPFAMLFLSTLLPFLLDKFLYLLHISGISPYALSSGLISVVFCCVVFPLNMF